MEHHRLRLAATMLLLFLSLVTLWTILWIPVPYQPRQLEKQLQLPLQDLRSWVGAKKMEQVSFKSFAEDGQLQNETLVVDIYLHSTRGRRGSRRRLSQQRWEEQDELGLDDDDGDWAKDDDVETEALYRKAFWSTPTANDRRYLRISSHDDPETLRPQGYTTTAASTPPTNRISSAELLTITLVAISTMVMVVAILLLLMDLRDRCRLKRAEELHQQKRNALPNNATGTTTESGPQPPPVLPSALPGVASSMPVGCEEFDVPNSEISHLSSMTSSLVEHDEEDPEEAMAKLERAIMATANEEAPDPSLVTTIVAVSSAPVVKSQSLCTGHVQAPPSPSSSTPQSHASGLQGEDVLQTPTKRPYQPTSHPTLPFDLSPDTPEAREQSSLARHSLRSVETRDELSQLEYILSSIPTDSQGRVLSPIRLDMQPPMTHCIFDLVYQPLPDVGLGVTLTTAPLGSTWHPMVEAVDKNSPLAARLQPGDYYLRLNDIDTDGMDPARIERCLAQSTTLLKLTLLRVRDPEDGPSVKDFGLPESAVEV